jgi:hypothetical protein
MDMYRRCGFALAELVATSEYRGGRVGGYDATLAPGMNDRSPSREARSGVTTTR